MSFDPPPAAAQTDEATADIVDRIALSLNGEFGVQEVVDEFIKEKRPEPNRSTVSGRLKHLEKEGRLVLLTKGMGQKPSVYHHPGGNGVSGKEVG